jgi:hypothetical protein
MTCNLLTLYQTFKILKKSSVTKKIFKSFANNLIRNFRRCFFCAVARLTNKYKKRIYLLVTDSKTDFIKNKDNKWVRDIQSDTFCFSKIVIIG